MALPDPRTNPPLASTSFNTESMGGNMNFFTVDYIVAINGGLGPIGSATGALQAALAAMQKTCTIVAMGPLMDSNTQQTYAVEGDATVATLQTAIRALANPTGGVNMSGATVTATQLGILTAAVIALP